MKGHVVELLKSVFATQSPDDSMLPDVMATIFATILAELSFFSSQVSSCIFSQIFGLKLKLFWCKSLIHKEEKEVGQKKCKKDTHSFTI